MTCAILLRVELLKEQLKIELNNLKDNSNALTQIGLIDLKIKTFFL